MKKLWVLEGRLSLRGLWGVAKSKQERLVKECEMSRRDDNEWKGGKRVLGLVKGCGRGEQISDTDMTYFQLGI